MKPGYIENPVAEFAKRLRKKIKQNSGYCLNKEKGIKDNKCPCLAFREGGECVCGLYIKDPSEMLFWDD